MDDLLRQYLTKYYPEVIPQDTPIICGNGWFPLILWSARFLHSYHDSISTLAKEFPDKHKPISQPRILRVERAADGLLRIDAKGGNERTKEFIHSIEYISGNICEKSTSIFGNVVIATSDEVYVVNERFVKGRPGVTYEHLDNEELRALLQEKISGGDLLGQLEFDFKL